MAEMILHEGVYYTHADLKAKLSRDEAAAAKAKADAAALAVSESGLADAKAVGERLLALSERVDQLAEQLAEQVAEQVAALGSAFAELQKATEDAAGGAESDETGEGEGDAPADAGSGASEPSGADEAVKPRTARARKGA